MARGLVYLGLTALMWGLNWPVNKLVLAQLPPFTFRTCTGLVGGVLFLGLTLARRETLRVPAGQWPALLTSTLLNFAGWITLTALALLWLPASEAVIIAYTMPIWAALLAVPILGERPRPAGIAGLALGLAGVAILVLAQPLHASWTQLPGALCGFGAALCFALGTLLGKRMPVRLPPFAGVLWQIAIGTLPLLAAALLFDHPDFRRVSLLGWIGVAYVGVVGLGLGYVTWFAALRLLPASTISTGALTVPVIGVLSSAVLLGEPLGPRQILALLLTLTGVGLASRR